MKNKVGRPRGSKNQPTLFKLKRTKLDTLKLSRECLRIVHSRAHGSGLAPQTVLEDLIMAGDYTMGQAYDNLSNFRKRIREKASERNNVVPITSTEAAEGKPDGQSEDSIPEQRRDLEYAVQGMASGESRSDDAPSERGHRPEDNPAFGNIGAVGDVIGTVGQQETFDPGRTFNGLSLDADPGPEYLDEEGNPIEPQEVHEALEE